MITGRSRTIGLVVADLDNHFYPQALEKLSTALKAEGYHILVFMAPRTAGDIEEVVAEILDYQMDGIIAALVALSSMLAARCRDAGVPVVFFNRTQDGEGQSSVTSDNVAGGRLAARFLTAGGHRRIEYIAGWEGASTQRDREAGPARPGGRLPRGAGRGRAADRVPGGRRLRTGRGSGCCAPDVRGPGAA